MLESLCTPLRGSSLSWSSGGCIYHSFGKQVHLVYDRQRDAESPSAGLLRGLKAAGLVAWALVFAVARLQHCRSQHASLTLWGPLNTGG